MIDNLEVNEVLEILESIKDEKLAVELLAEFNEKSKATGNLLLNKSPELSHDEWKVLCDDAQKELNDIIVKIKSYK